VLLGLLLRRSAASQDSKALAVNLFHEFACDAARILVVNYVAPIHCVCARVHVRPCVCVCVCVCVHTYMDYVAPIHCVCARECMNVCVRAHTHTHTHTHETQGVQGLGIRV